MVTNEELVEMVLNEAKRVVGLKRLKERIIEWRWAESAELKKENARAIVRRNGNRYTICLPQDFTKVDWRIYEDDEETCTTFVDCVEFDIDGNPLPQYEEEADAKLRVWFGTHLGLLVHELLHVADWNMSHEEIYRKERETAKRFIRN